MTAPSLADAALSTGSRIGRYFSLVSVLPALFLSAWSVLLVAAGAWAGTPDLTKVGANLSGLTLGGYAWILLATVLTALFLHPLQLGMTRLLEGYWGSSRTATLLLRLRITHYRKKRLRLNRRQSRLHLKRERVLRKVLIRQYLDDLANDPGSAEDPLSLKAHELQARLVELMPHDKAHAASGAHAAMAAIPTQLARYPSAHRMMPTRLGNALRVAEDRIGRQYGLDAIVTAPHIALIAPESHAGQLQDTRQQMDTSIRLCVVALLAAVESAAALMADRWWLLAALLPYSLAWIAYRAAVAGADEYMTVVATVLDLNRFRLYEELKVKHPGDTDEERQNNKKLMDLLRGKPATLDYREPGDETKNLTPPGNP